MSCQCIAPTQQPRPDDMMRACSLLGRMMRSESSSAGGRIGAGKSCTQNTSLVPPPPSHTHPAPGGSPCRIVPLSGEQFSTCADMQSTSRSCSLSLSLSFMTILSAHKYMHTRAWVRCLAISRTYKTHMMMKTAWCDGGGFGEVHSLNIYNIRCIFAVGARRSVYARHINADSGLWYERFVCVNAHMYAADRNFPILWWRRGFPVSVCICVNVHMQVCEALMRSASALFWPKTRRDSVVEWHYTRIVREMELCKLA